MTFVVAGLVVLLGVVAFGLGGYEPWAMLILELGAAAVTFILVAEACLSAKKWDDAERRARDAAWRRLPFFVRHHGLARALTYASFGLVRARSGGHGVEFLMPTGDGREVELDVSRYLFVLGVPLRRSGLVWPLIVMTLWIGVSLVPIPRPWLAVVSPHAEQARVQSEALAGVTLAETSPMSLVPFLTARDLWLWLAVVALFLVALSLLRREPRNSSSLAASLLALGAISGVYGLAGWLQGLSESFGVASASLRARGSFGNANHYAMFQGMLVLVGLGWLGSVHRLRLSQRLRVRRGRGAPADESGLVLIAGIGVIVAALGLVLSLSRSGIAFTLGGTVVFVLLARERHRRSSRSLASSIAPYAAMGLGVLGLVVWLGIEPLVARFGDLGEQLDREGARVQVWRDSVSALPDFWLTGSGLASFRYVATPYRTLAGNVYFSWAHNDYLQLGIELGVPGLLMLGAIVASIVGAGRRVREELAQDPAQRALHAGYASALVFVALHSATDFGLHLPANLALVALVVAGAVGTASVLDPKLRP